MNKENIELLKAFCDAILPILIFTFIVILFFLYRKKIEIFSSKITKIKGKIAGQEFETEINERIIETNIGSNNTTANQNLIDDKILIEETEEETLFHLWSASAKKDNNKSKQIFEQIQQKELDPQKRVHNELFYFYVKSLNGDINSKSELEEYAKTIKFDEEKFEGYEYLGLISKHSRAYEKAIEEFNTAMTLAFNQIQKTTLTNYISECYYELGRVNEAENIFFDLLKVLTEDKAKCTCLQNLAEFYNKQKEHFSRALSLEKALEYEPNNIDILFKVAYSYSECNFNALSILHYKTLIFFNNEYKFAHNNLGVAYQFFNMPFKGNKEFKISSEQKNTLAAGNFASNLVLAGFYEEAKNVINEAKKIENYDNKVDEAYDNLTKSLKSEEEKEKEIVESAKKQERFLKKFYERNLYKIESINLSGEWVTNEDITIVNTSTSLYMLNLNWQVGQSKFEFSGSFQNLISQDIKYSDLKPGFTTLYRNSKGYAFINDSLDKIEVLILLENSHEIKEFTLIRAV